MKRKKPTKRGRPVGTGTGRNGRRVNLYLSEPTIQQAKNIGSGSVSAGVQIAVAAVRRNMIYAITETDARRALSATDMAAFEECNEHSVSDQQVDRDFSRFASRSEAKKYLRENGGGWFLDESGNSHRVDG